MAGFTKGFKKYPFQAARLTLTWLDQDNNFSPQRSQSSQRKNKKNFALSAFSVVNHIFFKTKVS